MHVSGVFLLVLTTLRSTHVRQNHAIIVSAVSDYNVVQRDRRSFSSYLKFGKLIYKGVTARHALLRGATKIDHYPSKGINGAKQFRYTKPGSWTQAKQDFHAVQPTNVESGNMGKIRFGSIGDRTIELQHSGPFDLPTIKIFTVKARGKASQLITEEIIYVDKPT